MSLSPVKLAVLENLLLSNSPVKPAVIAAETGNRLNSTMMHLIWLVRAGFAAAPEKGRYVITGKGKEALGIPKATRETAMGILAQSHRGKAFQFYSDLDKPLNLYADGVKDFLEKIPKVTVQSLEFHLNRGDFENWFKNIGDVETPKKLALLKKKEVGGENLRSCLQEMIVSRYTELSMLI